LLQSELFQTAVKKAKAGQRSQARALLLELVETEPQHELAWLWLSELVDEPEDKIIALENALTLNPRRPQTQQRLAQLRQKYASASQTDGFTFSANGAAKPTTTEEIEFEEIQQQFAAGRIQSGLQQLASFLHLHANHEAGWWLMVQQADSQSNRLKALDHLLQLNTKHPEAPAILAQISPTSEDFWPMGRLHERLEQWQKAAFYYKRALKSPNLPDRLLAKKRLPFVQEQIRLANIKLTSPTATVVRLAIGPTLLYALLIWVQSGLKPLNVSPLLCGGNLLFMAGLLLLGGLTHAPDHPWLVRLRGTAVSANPSHLRLIATICVVLPILLLLLLAINRLLIFQLDLNSLL
jgi:hypothetical protein